MLKCNFKATRILNLEMLCQGKFLSKCLFIFNFDYKVYTEYELNSVQYF